MTGTNILILEHDPDLSVDLARSLRDGGYSVVVAADGGEGLRAALAEPPALILIDLLIPATNGLEVCRRLRDDPKTATVPVLLLASRANAEAKAAAQAAGADGCLGRSIVSSELLPRVQALLLREGADTPQGVLNYAGVVLDRVRRRVFVANREARLTPPEFRLLECLMADPGRAYRREELVNAAVLHGQATERVVDVHIKTLRKKLGVPGLIEAVRRVGYRLRPTP
jgi:two-component system phosphate regulon response regulator PhoB